jgi:hypothetical protein
MANTTGIIYLIQPVEYLNTNVYKIGCSSKNDISRLTSYKKGFRPLHISICKNPFKLEKIIKEEFNAKYTLIKGREYFSGNESKIIKNFKHIVEIYNDNMEEENEEVHDEDGETNREETKEETEEDYDEDDEDNLLIQQLSESCFILPDTCCKLIDHNGNCHISIIEENTLIFPCYYKTKKGFIFIPKNAKLPKNAKFHDNFEKFMDLLHIIHRIGFIKDDIDIDINIKVLELLEKLMSYYYQINGFAYDNKIGQNIKYGKEIVEFFVNYIVAIVIENKKTSILITELFNEFIIETKINSINCSKFIKLIEKIKIPHSVEDNYINFNIKLLMKFFKMFDYNNEQIAQEKNNMILAEKLYDFNNGNTDNDEYFKFNYTHGFIDLKHSRAIFNPPYIEHEDNKNDDFITQATKRIMDQSKINYEINCVNNFNIEEKCYIKKLKIKTLEDLIRCEYIDKKDKSRALGCFNSPCRIINYPQYKGCISIKISPHFIFVVQILNDRRVIFLRSMDIKENWVNFKFD